jgi:cell division protein FtsL
MSSMETVILTLIVTAFLVFSITLAYESSRDR